MYVMCINNESNPESLDLRKIYRAVPDAEGAKHGYIRVFDESGEGYLYPARYFITVALPGTLPRKARNIFAWVPMVKTDDRVIGDGSPGPITRSRAT